MLEISLLGLDALEIEEILLRDVLGLGRVVFHAATTPYPAGYYGTPSNTPTYVSTAVYYNAPANQPPASSNNNTNIASNFNNNTAGSISTPIDQGGSNTNPSGGVSTPQPSLQQQQQHITAALYYYPAPNIHHE